MKTKKLTTPILIISALILGISTSILAGTYAWKPLGLGKDISSSSLWTENGADIYRTSGKVGIGNSAPSKTLDVTGDINFTGSLYNNSHFFDLGDLYRVTYNNNLFIGESTGMYATDNAENNIGIFDFSLDVIQNGSDNIAIGYKALGAVDDGDSNIGIGRLAGSETSIGYGVKADKSIFIGGYTKSKDEYTTNEIVIGYNATGVGSNSVVLGNNDITKTILKGNVGIGTTSPDTNLEVYNDTKAEIQITRDTDQYFWSAKEDDVMKLLIHKDNSSWKDPVIAFRADTGNVGIGTTAPSEKLEVNGKVKAQDFIYSSDRRLKKNIRQIDSALDKITKLKGVSFQWKENGEKSLGLIAQDVEKVFPELVWTGKDKKKMKGVKYASLIAPLIEAVKEQQKEIEELKGEIIRLKNNK